MAAGSIDRAGINNFWLCAVGKISNIHSFTRFFIDRVNIVNSIINLCKKFWAIISYDIIKIKAGTFSYFHGATSRVGSSGVLFSSISSLFNSCK
jgi:hypothetical protein